MVSLEEAKQITARFEGESFVPPPRTINDILSNLLLVVGEEDVTLRGCDSPLTFSDENMQRWMRFRRPFFGNALLCFRGGSAAYAATTPQPMSAVEGH